VLVQGWSMVCTERTIGIEIVLDELDGIPRSRSSSGSLVRSVSG
jgi:hypothetical protein